jgi:hypothetical protein
MSSLLIFVVVCKFQSAEYELIMAGRSADHEERL